MITGSVMSGRGESGSITRSESGRSKRMMFWPVWLLAASIASRSEPGPLSAPVVTVNTSTWDGGIATAAENSEVSLNVAVVVMNAPGATAAGRLASNWANPVESVETTVVPRNVCPWPYPDGSATAFEKNSMTNVELGVLVSVPNAYALPP